MTNKLRAVAESRFAALTRRETTAMNEIESEYLATQEKTARLRAERIARETRTAADHAARLHKRRNAEA